MIDKQQFSLWYFVGAVVALLLLQSYFTPGHRQTLLYSEFKSLLSAGKLIGVNVGTDTISGTFSTQGIESVLAPDKVKDLAAYKLPTHPFTTVRVEDPQLVAQLEAAKVPFAGEAENRALATLFAWIAPAVIFIAIWSFAMKRMGSGAHGLMEIGKSKAKVYMEKATGVTFADVAGIDEAKEELSQVVDFLRNPERYRRLGGNIPKGILIVGAPGTGKTLLAKAVAGEAAVPFFSLSGSEFVEMFVGVGAARVRDLFDQAQKSAPCIVFIDELDALGKARGITAIAGGGNDEREQTLNQLLVQMDGFDTNRGVIIMAATNRPEILDPALLRPGRFDRHVAIEKPDVRGREQILRVHTKHVTLAPDISLSAVAARTPGFVGADLANIVNEAALHAATLGKDAVGMADFDEAIDRVVGGLERKNRVMNAKEKETVAYHEAGHALVAEFRPGADRVSKISIIPRGIAALGYTQQIPTEDRYLLKRSELLDRIDVLLGGRVAEELVFGDVSTGAQNDLQRATDLARHMIMHYGMSESLGLATFEEPRAMFLDLAGPVQRAEYSERTAQAIDDEIRRLLGASQARVHDTLAAHREVLDDLARLLRDKEVVDRATLDALVRPAASAVEGAAAHAG